LAANPAATPEARIVVTRRQFFGKRRQAIVVIFRPAEFDRYITILNETHFAKASPQRCKKIRRILTRPSAEKTDYRHSRLLRTRR
jgi:hypothetical protein